MPYTDTDTSEQDNFDLETELEVVSGDGELTLDTYHLIRQRDPLGSSPKLKYDISAAPAGISKLEDAVKEAAVSAAVEMITGETEMPSGVAESFVSDRLESSAPDSSPLNKLGGTARLDGTGTAATGGEVTIPQVAVVPVPEGAPVPDFRAAFSEMGGIERPSITFTTKPEKREGQAIPEFFSSEAQTTVDIPVHRFVSVKRIPRSDFGPDLTATPLTDSFSAENPLEVLGDMPFEVSNDGFSPADVKVVQEGTGASASGTVPAGGVEELSISDVSFPDDLPVFSSSSGGSPPTLDFSVLRELPGGGTQTVDNFSIPVELPDSPPADLQTVEVTGTPIIPDPPVDPESFTVALPVRNPSDVPVDVEVVAGPSGEMAWDGTLEPGEETNLVLSGLSFPEPQDILSDPPSPDGAPFPLKLRSPADAFETIERTPTLPLPSSPSGVPEEPVQAAFQILKDEIDVYPPSSLDGSLGVDIPVAETNGASGTATLESPQLGLEEQMEIPANGEGTFVLDLPVSDLPTDADEVSFSLAGQGGGADIDLSVLPEPEPPAAPSFELGELSAAPSPSSLEEPFALSIPVENVGDGEGVAEITAPGGFEEEVELSPGESVAVDAPVSPDSPGEIVGEVGLADAESGESVLTEEFDLNVSRRGAAVTRIESVDFDPEEPEAGENVEVSVTVSNQNTTPAPNEDYDQFWVVVESPALTTPPIWYCGVIEPGGEAVVDDSTGSKGGDGVIPAEEGMPPLNVRTGGMVEGVDCAQAPLTQPTTDTQPAGLPDIVPKIPAPANPSMPNYEEWDMGRLRSAAYEALDVPGADPSTINRRDAVTILRNNWEPPAPELTLADVDFPSSVTPGEGVPIDVTLGNIGGQEAPVTLSTPSDSVEATVPADGEPHTSTLMADAPSSPPSGGEMSVPVTVVNEATGNELSESVSVGVEEPPDPAEFLIDSIDIPSQLKPGEGLSLSVVVENVGEVADEATVSVNPTESATIQPGSTETFTFDLEPPAPGEEQAFVIETPNDSREVSVETLIPAEFIISDLSLPDSPRPNEILSIGAVIENVGGVEDSATIEGPGGSQQVSLGPGESTTLTFEPSAPSAGGEADYTIETPDDSASSSVTTPPPAEFTISDITTPDEVNPGNRLTIEAVIENVGGVEDSATIEGPTGPQQVTLGPGESTTVAFEPFGPEAGTEGTFTVETPDDSDSVSVETLSPAEFVVEDVVAPDMVDGGDQITLEATVRNIGGVGDSTQVSGPSGTQQVTLSPGGSEMVTFTTAAPPAGEYQQFTIEAGGSSRSVMVGTSPEAPEPPAPPELPEMPDQPQPPDLPQPPEPPEAPDSPEQPQPPQEDEEYDGPLTYLDPLGVFGTTRQLPTLDEVLGRK